MRFTLLPLVLLTAGLASQRAHACVPPPGATIPVGPNFQVRVSGPNGPVKGLRLEAAPGGRGTLAAMTTDEAGMVSFHNVPNGYFTIRAAPDNGLSLLSVEVRSERRDNVMVPMHWPAIEAIRVRQLAGSFTAIPTGFIPKPLELMEGISGRILATVPYSSQGEFDFGKEGPFAPGIYFIHTPLGLVGVTLDTSSASHTEKLDLNLVSADCGLTYVDQSQCTYPSLRARDVAGHLDQGWLPGAKISIHDAGGREVAQTNPDTAGNFFLPETPSGRFQLRMVGLFTPVHMPIEIDPGAPRSSLEIENHQLACSTVRLK